jgi:hypothetical protein
MFGDNAYGYSKSKPGFESWETAIYLPKIFFAPGDHPWLWDRSLRYFSKSIFLPVSGELLIISLRSFLPLKTFFRENWG